MTTRPTLSLLPTLTVLASGVATAGDPGTLWYGGIDPESGTAVADGVWDFESCDLQGWTSVDLTDEGLHGTHVTADSIAAHGDPASPVITADGSTGSLWIGMHEDDARARCWPGGQGYGHVWHQQLAKSFEYAGTGSVEVAFDYFVDHSSFDVTRVFVVDDQGVRSPYLNPGPFGFGYYGSVQEGSPIGTPMAPAREHLVVPSTYLPETPGAAFEVLIEFESDDSASDQFDRFGSVHDTVWGPFGIDGIEVSGVDLFDLSDFEPGGLPGDELDGWELRARPPIGAFASVTPLGDLDTEDLPPDCPVWGCVLTVSDLEGPDPHPYLQYEAVRSNPAVVPDSLSIDHAIVEWDVWEESLLSLATGYFVGVETYPWTCPETGAIGWSPVPIQDGPWGYKPECRDDFTTTELVGLGDADSIRVIITFQRRCPFGGGGECGDSESAFDAPYWDNIRLGLVPSAVSFGDAALDPRSLAIRPLRNPADDRIDLTLVAPTPSARVTVAAFDVTGRLVREVYDDVPPPGEITLSWDGTDARGGRVASGTYFVRASTTGLAPETTKVVIP